jgi:hypothetical protein
MNKKSGMKNQTGAAIALYKELDTLADTGAGHFWTIVDKLFKLPGN